MGVFCGRLRALFGQLGAMLSEQYFVLKISRVSDTVNMAGMRAGGGAGDAAVHDRGQPGDRHPAAHDAPDAMEYLTACSPPPASRSQRA